MLLSPTLLTLLQLATAHVPRAAAAPAPASGACTSDPYAKLDPLAYFQDAQKFCSKKYPRTVTVTATPKPKRGASTTSSITTTSTTAETTTSAKSTTAEKCTKNPLECLYETVKKGERNGVAKTFCSCYGPRKTVTEHPTTTVNPSPTCTSAPLVIFGNCAGDTFCNTMTTCTRQDSQDACENACADAEDIACTDSIFDPDSGECFFYPDCCPQT